MPEFQRFGGHNGANRGSDSIPGRYRHISLVMSLRKFGQKSLQPGEVRRRSLLGSWKLLKESVDGVHVEVGHQLLQFGKQDTDQTGNGLFEFRSFSHFVKSVSCE